MASIKVADLRPDTQGHNLQVKVVEAPQDVQATGSSRMAEGIVGDETGIINFVARQDQVDLVQGAKDLELRDAKVEMFKGSMRLSVPELGSIQALTSPLSIKANVSGSAASKPAAQSVQAS